MELKLTTGQIVLIDDEDFDKLNKGRSLQLNKDGLVYLRLRVNNVIKPKGIHRVVMDAKIGEEIDHKNLNTLDNRKSNLRRATRSQNAMNRGPQKKMNNHPYKGIKFHNRESLKSKWQACVKVNGKSFSGGYFFTAIEAARKYDELAKLHHGEFARLNFKE
jgi:hypothetical protein